MKLSDQARAHIRAREEEEQINAVNKRANDRKRTLYWIGFLEGALASKRIEAGEAAALQAEANNFARFFDDPDASDLAQDLHAECFSNDDDLMEQLRQIISDRRSAAQKLSAYTEADEMNEFLGFCGGIICDGKVLESEAAAILGRFRESDVLMHAAAFATLRRAVESAMSDNALTLEESAEVQEWISRLVGDGYADTGIPNIGNVARLDDLLTDPLEIKLRGSHFVVTGPMRMGTRTFVASEIMRVGGVYEERTTRKTDFLVVSSDASRHWRTTHFGTKIERAKELIEEGYKLRFITEMALAEAIRLHDTSIG